MDLTIAVEHRFERTADGAVWTPTSLARPSWCRYLGAFERVRILARARLAPKRDPRWLRVDGDGVELVPVPWYVGPREYLARRDEVARSIRAALDAHPRDAVILRVPGTLGSIAGRALRSAGRPFGLEVVGDPWDVFAPGSVDHPLRAFLRAWSTHGLRRLCTFASTSLYVTEAALQRRYPPRPGARTFGISDVELGDDAFVAAPRRIDAPSGPPFTIVHVGTLEQLYKAPDVLVRAVARSAADGLDVVLVLVGDGRHRRELADLARRLRIAPRVRFAGHLPSGAAVRRELDRGHLFVLPSRQEGMPRALVEAMARGLPCLATAVGGIPELLAGEDLVPRDPAAIAARIREVARSARARAEMSRRNLARARRFHDRMLQPRREEFYRHLAAVTAGRAPAPEPAARPASTEPAVQA